jgi:hypothetical protein
MVSLNRNKKAPPKVWRPDFRDTQTLPDTKVIRTGFLLNFIAIALALAAMSSYLLKEYRLQGLIREVDKLTAQVDSSQSQNRAILDVNKKFRQSAEVVSEAVAFDFQEVPFAELIASLSAVLGEGMILSAIQVDYSAAPVEDDKAGVPMIARLTGRVMEEAPGTPAKVLDNFQESIRSLSILEGKTVSIDMENFGRNNEFGYFDFTLLVKIELQKPATL